MIKYKGKSLKHLFYSFESKNRKKKKKKGQHIYKACHWIGVLEICL